LLQGIEERVPTLRPAIRPDVALRRMRRALQVNSIPPTRYVSLSPLELRTAAATAKRDEARSGSPTHLEAGHIRDTQPHDEGDYRLERPRDPRCRDRSHRAPQLDLGHPGEAARTAGNTRSFDHSVANEPCLAGPKAVRLYTETTKSFGARSWVTSACPFVNHVHANI